MKYRFKGYNNSNCFDVRKIQFDTGGNVQFAVATYVPVDAPLLCFDISDKHNKMLKQDDIIKVYK